jgi:hypothetical protein
MKFLGNDLTKGVRSAFPPVAPAFTYSGGALTRIDYADGSYKVFSYSAGALSQIDFVSGGITRRKTLIYSGGSLASITETVI